MSVLRPAALAVVASLALAGCGDLITRDLTPPAARGDSTSTPVAAVASPTTGGATKTPAPAASTAHSPSASPTHSSAPSPTPSTTPAAPVNGVTVLALAAPAAASSIPAGTWGLGDSFMLGSKRVLTAHHVVVDAKVSRQFYEGIPILLAKAKAGTLPRNILIHLGTNGSIEPKHCTRVMAVAGPQRRVFFVTVIGPRSWMAKDDVILRACQARYPSQVVIVDWAAVTTGHPEYIGPDKVHPNPRGRKIYNALLLSALKSYSI